MKKLLSVLLCITMLMSGMSVFADTFDEFADIINASQYSDFACSAKMSVSLDAPIEILELANEALAEEDVYIDLSGIVGSFFNMAIDMDMKLNTSEDLKIIKSEIKMKTNLPLVINDSLKITVDMNTDMYINIDVTDVENPSFSMIFTVPVYDKYIVIDSCSLMQDEQMADQIKEFMKMYAETLSQISKLDLSLFKDCYTIKKTKSTYTLSISDKQFKSLMKKLPEIVFDMNLPGMDELTEQEKLEFNVQYAAIMGVIDNFSILGDNGAVSVFTVDGGKIKQADNSISFDFNLYDIANAFIIMSGDYDTDELNEMLSPFTKENSRIAFTLRETDIYSYDSESIKITLPKLTEENSIDIIEELYSDIEDEYIYDDYSYDYFRVRVLGLPKRTSDGFPYIPVRQSFVTSGLEEENIGWEKIGDESVVTVKGNETLNFKELKITNKKDGESTVYIDGTQYTGEGAYMLEGKSYISASLFSELVGYDYDKYSENIYYEYDGNYYMCVYYFEKYIYPEETITDSDSYTETEEKELELPVVKNDPVAA